MHDAFVSLCILPVASISSEIFNKWQYRSSNLTYSQPPMLFQSHFYTYNNGLCYEAFFPFNSVFSLSIFLKEAHFNSSVEIRFMEGGCFRKLALSVHLQELFFPPVHSKGFFLSTMQTSSAFAIFYFVCAPLCNRWNKLMSLVDFSFFFFFFTFF